MSSFLDQKKIKKISQKQKDIVYGYVNKMQSLLLRNGNDNPYYNINQLIKDLCLLFYRQFNDYFTINNKTTFNYINKEHKNWYHIFGEQIIQRGNLNEYKWKIKTDERFKGRMGIIDVTKDGDIKSVKNGIAMYQTDNVICCGTQMYGNVYGDPDTRDLYSFYESDDIFTITVNYQQNSIKFNSKKKGSTVITGLLSSTNCVRFIAEFVSYDASITILCDQ